jgi:hypothetical protein
MYNYLYLVLLAVKNKMDQHVTDIVLHLHFAFEHLSMNNLVEVVVRAMEIAQKLESLEGPQKKEVVMRAVTRFVDEKDLLGPLEDVLLNLVPVMIDNLVAADRNKLMIHPQVVCAARGCFAFLKKKMGFEKSN